MKKVHIVTGGTSGMGLSTAQELGRYGMVFVGGRNQNRLDDAVSKLKANGVDAQGHVCDIADRESLEQFARAAQELGEIGHVVNAAGLDYDAASSEKLIRVNMGGTINVVETFMPLMRDACLVNYSSITGYFYTPSPEEKDVWDHPDAHDFVAAALEKVLEHPNPQAGMLPDEYVTYCGTKAFVIYYTKANTVRFADRGLRIFSVAPGSFLTPMLEGQSADLDRIAQGTAFKRLGNPDEIGKLIADLVDPALGYLTGCDIIMDGGKMAMVLAKQLS